MLKITSSLLEHHRPGVATWVQPINKSQITIIKAGNSTISTNTSGSNWTSPYAESIFPRIPTNKPCTPPKSNMLWLNIFPLRYVLQTHSGEGGYRLSAIKFTTTTLQKWSTRTGVRVGPEWLRASHLTPPSSLMCGESLPRLSLIFCRCLTFGCRSCLHKKHKKTSPKNTRDLHDAHFRSLPTYFASASAACVNDCSNLIGLVMQIKVTAEFPDVHVPTDVSALGKRGDAGRRVAAEPIRQSARV